MCDQNIAVSVRTLSQKSSILPNRMEKLKLTSLAAGIVAGFTTDSHFSEDVGLAKGYNANVASRVDELAHVLINYVVLNRTWYNTGARTISETRNIFITGRKHPLNTLASVFNLVRHIEMFHADNKACEPINEALDVMRVYGIDTDTPFHRLIANTREQGLKYAIGTYRDFVLKTAKRMGSDGKRLDILDDHKLSVLLSAVTGTILAYCEPLPTTAVDFNSYYATTAYPMAASLVNQLVETMVINTDALFSVYRSTLETRYELAYEPVVTVRGLIGFMSMMEVFPEDIRLSFNDANKTMLLDYIVDMVKGVYDVRKEHAERTVLHELDYLPVDINPIGDLVSKPETHADIEKHMEQLIDSAESLLPDLDPTAKKYNSLVSNEAFNGRQIIAIGALILGGTFAIYYAFKTFFEKSSASAKATADRHDKFREEISRVNKELDEFTQQMANERQRLRQSAVNSGIIDKQIQDTLLKHGMVNPPKANTIVDAIKGKSKLEDVDMKGKYELKGISKEDAIDLSGTNIADCYAKFGFYQKALANDEFEKLIEPATFSKFKTIEQFDDHVAKLSMHIVGLGKTYSRLNIPKLNTNIVTDNQLSAFIKNNVFNMKLSASMQEAAAYATKHSQRTSKIDYDKRRDEYATVITGAIEGISEEDLKECLDQIKSLNATIQKTYKEMGHEYVLLNKNLVQWDKFAAARQSAFQIIRQAWQKDVVNF